MTERYGIDFRRMRFLINRLPMARFRLMCARSQATRITAVISDMPHGTEVSSPVERGYTIVEAAQEALEKISAELQEMRCQLSGKLATLQDPLEITAMQMRYMDGFSVREIAFSLNYSERRIFQVLSCAENRVNKTFH